MNQILIVAPFYYPHLGGVEKHVFATNKELIERKYKLTLITSLHKKHLHRIEQQQHLNIIRISTIKVRFVGLLWIWLQIFWHFIFTIGSINQFKAIHVHDVMLWLLPWSLVKSFFWPKVRLVLTIHGWEGTFPIPKKNIYLKQLAVFLADHTFIVGQYLQKYYQLNKKHLFVNHCFYGGLDKNYLQNWIFKNKLIIDNKQESLRKTSDKQKINLLYLGRLDYDTPLPILLTALQGMTKKQLSLFQIIFAGEGKLQLEAKKYGKVLGMIEPLSYLQETDICLASGYLSILEALSQKCQTIVAYDNLLKRDYYTQTPFSKWITIVNGKQELIKILLNLANTKNLAMLRARCSSNLENQQSFELRNFLISCDWQNIAKLYQEVYRD